jgi:3',5'-cyclic AMP phosphodiesterase CpdA
MNRNRKPTRRELMGMSAGALLAAGVWPGALRADGEAEAGDFHFLVLNDAHWVDRDDGGWFDGLARQIRGHEEKPELVLLAGDLADDGQPDQVGAMRDFCKELRVPVYVVPGNHDYRGRGDRMAVDRKAYDQLFPNRLNYRFDHRGWQFVALDSTEGALYKETLVQPDTLNWLNQAVPNLDKKRPLIVFTHFPLGPGVRYRPGNADNVLNQFRQHNLKAVFCGHVHAETERKVGAVVLTTNRCCSHAIPNHDGSKQKGYYLCRAKDGEVTRTFVGYPQG